MATLEQLQAILQPTRLVLTGEHADGKFLLTYLRQLYFISEIDVDQYLAIKDQLTIDPETAIFRPGYFEQLVEVQGGTYLLRRSIRTDSGKIEMENLDHSLKADISAATTSFMFRMFEGALFPKISRHIFRFLPDEPEGIPQPRNFTELFRRFTTIKITASNTLPYFDKKAKLHRIAEAALFHFSYGTGISINIRRSWDRDISRTIDRTPEPVQFPRRVYITDLVSYYQLALSSDSLILRFISLYKVLEYFFSTAAEKEIHSRLAEKLTSPEFSHAKSNQLRDLTLIVRKHDQRMDEQRMLSTVIQQYFRPDEIANWIQTREAETGSHYTNSTPVFGQELPVDLSPENLAPSIAKRIYHIRNVLVHNKEGDLPRFIPFSGQEAILNKEIPLALYLAERLILKTGEDI